ncbi:hypothetical protein CL619_01520 [archaeon]|nr:hypothetical protein [archaeon]
MVLAASHVIGALGISLLVSRFLPVSNLGYALAAFGALIPDFDFLFALIFNDLSWHRAYLNFWFIPFLIFGIGCLIFPKKRVEVLLFSLGYLSHIILDLLSADLFILGLIDGVVITVIVFYLLIFYWKQGANITLNGNSCQKNL